MKCCECGKDLKGTEWVYIGGHKFAAHWTCVWRLWALKAPSKANAR